MHIIQESYTGLFGQSRWKYEPRLKYSGKFSGYNANIKLAGNELTVSMSRAWKDVSREIKVGLIQHLLLKLFRPKSKMTTMHIDLYNLFTKNLHLSVEKDNIDPELSSRFDIINNRFFNGMLDKPNLAWGEKTFRKLGHYEYGEDLIVISSLLRDAGQELIDYVLYHEMLHKKLKFQSSGTRTRYHSAEFKRLEQRFPNAKQLEKELEKLATRKRLLSFDFF